MTVETHERRAFAMFAGESPRERLLAALRAEVLGPEKPDEILAQSPATRYLVGMLAPQNTPADPTEDERQVAGGEEGGGDSAPISMSLAQSSIGLSFVVAMETESVTVDATWGEYHKVERAEPVITEESAEIDRDAEPEVAPKRKRKDFDWHRVPQHASIDMDLRTWGR